MGLDGKNFPVSELSDISVLLDKWLHIKLLLKRVELCDDRGSCAELSEMLSANVITVNAVKFLADEYILDKIHFWEKLLSFSTEDTASEMNKALAEERGNAK